MSQYWGAAFEFDTTHDFAKATPTLFLAHCKAHKTHTQKPTLPRAKNANAQPVHPADGFFFIA